MKKLLLALTLFAGACAPVLVPAPYRARVYAPRAVYLRAPAPVVVVPRHRYWW
jgi:hypothetical protein